MSQYISNIKFWYGPKLLIVGTNQKWWLVNSMLHDDRNTSSTKSQDSVIFLSAFTEI